MTRDGRNADRPGPIARWRTIVSAAAVSWALFASPAVAAIDITGSWLMSWSASTGISGQCQLAIAQTGTSLSTSGTCDSVGSVTLAGTIDVDTGALALNGSAAVLCTTLQFTATASPAGNFLGGGLLDCAGITGTFTAVQVVDTDGDSVLDDGDASGIAGDDPCASGVVLHCDDNCPTVPNPDQADGDADGVGDACDGLNVTGSWLMSWSASTGVSGQCQLAIVQTGTSLSTSGTCDATGSVTLAGTIDFDTGALTLSGSSTGICTTLQFTATASPTGAFLGDGHLDCMGITGTFTAVPLIDADGDSVPDDGDASGVAGDHPCASGVVMRCDDNCPTVSNPDQVDGNADGTGDACDGSVDCSVLPDGTPCPDDEFCNGWDTCQGGVCVHAGDPCVGLPVCGDICDETYDTCFAPPGTPCPDDGLPSLDVCNGFGGCSHLGVPGDQDGDGVADDGDGSGTPGDDPCVGGATAGCDDNCPTVSDPSQSDVDGDGVGDLCDYNCRGATGATLGGHIFRDAAVAGNELADAQIAVCGSNCCAYTTSDASGAYAVAGLAADDFRIYVYPPPSEAMLLSSQRGPLHVDGTEALTDQDVVLATIQPLPSGTTITSRGSRDGVPIVPPGPLTLTTTGCPGGTAQYEVLANGGVVATGPLAEDPVGSGSYAGTVAPWPWASSVPLIRATVTCSDLSTDVDEFNVYIDPSGVVIGPGGTPRPGATVTLLHAEGPLGPFVPVPDGSAVMSPLNRQNPDTTDAEGRYRWDVIAGYYKVRAEQAGCVTESEVLTIPPPVTDLILELACPDHYACYKAAASRDFPKFAPQLGVSVLDALGADSVSVRKPKMMCAPAAVGGGDPTAPGHPDQLESYQITGMKRVPVTRVVTDRFGVWRLVAVKATGIQVPTALHRTIPPAPPASPAVDRFQCYKVKRAADGLRFAPITTALDDQFQTVPVAVLKPTRLCLTANVGGTTPGAEGHRDQLMCYKAKAQSAVRMPRQGPLHLANQLGPTTLDAVKLAELCVPARVAAP